jgi:hypothetical protein
VDNLLMDRRTDRLTQLYIDAIINGLAGTGHQTAAQALRELGIPLATALRVLTRPGERRRPSLDRDVYRNHLFLAETSIVAVDCSAMNVCNRPKAVVQFS